MKREKESSQPLTSSEPSSDSAYYGTADNCNRANYAPGDYRDSVTRQDSEKTKRNSQIRTMSNARLGLYL